MLDLDLCPLTAFDGDAHLAHARILTSTWLVVEYCTQPALPIAYTACINVLDTWLARRWEIGAAN